MAVSKESPIALIPQDSRLTTFPLARPNTWAWYEDATNAYWTPKEVDMSNDAVDYERKLSPGEQRFVKYVLAFFAASDGIVNLNLVKRFKKDIKILEVGYFYDFQMAMENIHATMYSMLLDTIIPSGDEKKQLLNAIESMPIIKKMSQYMLACIASTASYAERLLRMVCVEGIFFQGCFVAIYWLQKKGCMKGLGQSNELIARDEALHTMFALHLYTMIKAELKLSKDEIYAIFREAVILSKEFIAEALPEGLAGMNAALMDKYIECQADNLVTLIDLPPIYGATHNLAFMEQLNLTNRTNFFERRVSEYSRTDTADNTEFEVAEYF